MIHGAAQCAADIGDDARRGPRPRSISVASRTPMSAASSPRVICGAPPIARYSAGSCASRRAARAPRRFVAVSVVRLDRERTRRSFCAPRVAAASRISPIWTSDARVGRIELDRFAQVLERRVGRSPAGARRRRARDRGTRCRATRRSPRVGRRASSSAPGPRRLAGARQIVLLGAAEPQHLDLPRHIGQRRVGGQRRFERGERFVVAVQRQQRLAAADERRHVIRPAARARDRNAAARPSASWRASAT